MGKPFSIGAAAGGLAAKLAAAEKTVRELLGGGGPEGGPASGPDWLRFVPEDVRGLVASQLPAGLRERPVETGKPQTGGTSGGTFLARSFANEAGTRPYKLFVPSAYAGQAMPLVVMLHGCTQSPDDFAAGTGMNRLAEAEGFLVVYPGQTASANAQKCWNWFKAGDQARGQGEPSLIAGITREVMREFAVDSARVYVAGLSAGGAAAAIMGETYPELYAAVGVHSGLACGAARDLNSALSAMRSGAPGQSHGAHRVVPAIVFHGDRDSTVSPRNADAVVAQSAADGRVDMRRGQVAGGREFECTVRRDETGRAVTEQWTVHGGGHAWFGGSAAGSYTDPRGPDATGEMMRFFREHPHPSPM